MDVTDPALERRLLTTGWALASALLAANAAFMAIPALEHVQALGQICGRADASHCLWCIAAVGLTASALVAAAQAICVARGVYTKKMTHASN